LVKYTILLAITVITNAFAQNSHFLNEETLLAGLEATYAGNYERAVTYWNEKITVFPDSPLWYLMKAATLLCKMEDTGDYSVKKKYEELIDTVLSKTEKSNDNYYKHLFRGLALGFRGTVKLKTGETITGVMDGRKSSGEMKRCISLNNTINVPYVFLGVYEYWKSKYLKSLYWIPLINDNRKKSINLIVNNMNGNSPLYYLNVNQLAWIYIDSGEYDKAVGLLKSCLSDFPKSRLFTYPLAEAYERKGDYNNAIKYYKMVAAALKNSNQTDCYTWYKAHIKLAEIFFHLKKPEHFENHIKILRTRLKNTDFYGREKVVKIVAELSEY